MLMPEDGMQATRRSKATWARTQNRFLAGVIVANVAVLTWTFWPDSPDTYEKCMERMADKAQGNATIFTRLASSNCHRLSPAYLEQQTKKLDAEIFLGK